MADQYTPLPVKTKAAGDVVVNVNNGTVTSVGTNVGLGTVSNIGVIHNAGTIASLPDPVGSVVVTAGTANVTAINADLPGGTVDLLSNVTTGSIANIAYIHEIGTMPSVGGGTQHDEDTPHTSGDGGHLVFGVRDDAGTSVFTSGTGDYSPISLTNKGEVRVSGASAGTIVEVNKGTINLGTFEISAIGADLPGGTVDLVSNLTNGSVRMTVGTLTQGSLTNIGNIHTAGTVSALPDLPGGTVDAVTNLAAGTITRIEGGTIDIDPTTSPQYNYQTSAALSAGGTVGLVFGNISDTTTGQLHKVVLSSSVPIRGAIQTYDGTTTTTAGVVFTSASNPSTDFTPPSKGYVTLTGSGTASKFQAHITNMDNALAADVYGVAFWDEV